MTTWTIGHVDTSQHLEKPQSDNDETWHIRSSRVGETKHLPSLVGIRPLGVAPRIREMYTSCNSSPSCLRILFLPFFLAYLHKQSYGYNFPHDGSKHAGMFKLEIMLCKQQRRSLPCIVTLRRSLELCVFSPKAYQLSVRRRNCNCNKMLIIEEAIAIRALRCSG